jgi:hypothetical protein
MPEKPARTGRMNLTTSVPEHVGTQFRDAASVARTNVSALLGSLIAQYLANA